MVLLIMATALAWDLIDMPVRRKDKFIGYFSQQAVNAGCGSVIYSASGKRQIEVTAVYRVGDNVEKSYLWKDKVCVGPLKKYLRQGQPSSYFMKPVPFRMTSYEPYFKSKWLFPVCYNC